MNIAETKKITLSLLDTFNKASQVALNLRKAGLIKEIKSDNTPVSNGDIEVNKILTSKIKEITPNIPIISELITFFPTFSKLTVTLPLIID